MGTAQASSQISPKNILFATDFSSCSEAALSFAFSIARRSGARIFAVHVISLSPFPNSPPTLVYQSLAAQAVREAQEAMNRLEPKWKGVPHETLIRKGDIWRELSRIIEEKQIDLVVCGTHGRTGAAKVLMGSVSEAIYRHAPCPVLTVGPRVAGAPESLGEIHSILCATDFTAESMSAAAYAVSFARENQARLYLLHVCESPVSGAVKEELFGRLRGLVPSGVELSCAPKAMVESGVPAEKITDLAEELMVDLIVLGPKRRAMLPGASHLPASTAHRVMSRAVCPVLTIRKRAGK